MLMRRKNCSFLVANFFEVAVAVGANKGCKEDGGVIGHVDEGGGHDGAEAEADVTQDEGDAEEKSQHGPGECGLIAVDESEEDAGEDCGKEERVAGEFVGGAPGLVGCRVAGKRTPGVGDGEGGEQEAAEEDFFKEGCEEDSEGSDEPDVGSGAEKVVHRDGFGQGDERGGGLDGEGESEAYWDEAEGVATSGVGVELKAFGEGAFPEKWEDKPRGDEGRDIAEGF